MRAVGDTIRKVGTGAVLLVLLAVLGCERSAGGSSIAPEELAKRLGEGNAPTVLDVRSEEEYRAGHIPGAIHVPHDELVNRLGSLDLPTSGEIVVHCQSGRRAEIARDILVGSGYERVLELEGHMAGWKAKGLPTDAGP